MRRKLLDLRRGWCRLFHHGIMFAGGPTYECRRCGQRFEHPAIQCAQPPTTRFPASFEGPKSVESAPRRLAAIFEP